MPGVSRFTLPEEFYDWTTSELLLQPEPQYLYAGLWKQAMGKALMVPSGGVGLPGRQTPSNGQPAVPGEMVGRLTLAETLLTETFGFKVDFKGKPGHTVRVNRPKFIDSTYTLASRRVSVGQTISTTPISVGAEQVTLTLDRFAGPYDQDAGNVAPYGVEAFDSQMGLHEMASWVGMNLKRDMEKFVESVMVALLDNCASTVRPGSAAWVDNDATTVNQYNFTYACINEAERTLDELNIPVFADGYRCLVISPKQAQNLKDDPQFARYAEKHAQYNALFPGYITSVNKLHIFKSNTLSKPLNSSSIPIHRAHMFGPGILAGAMGREPRVLSATDDNYGETGKVIWSMDADWILADNRFGAVIRST